MTNDKPAGKPQIERFRETARALGCDENKERFEATLGKIAAHTPQKNSDSGDSAKPERRKARSKE